MSSKLYLSFFLLLFASSSLFAQCEIGEIDFDISRCMQGEFEITLTFDFVNTSDSFDVGGNGMFRGRFAYADLPITIGPFDGDCTTRYELLVRDSEFPDCVSDVAIGTVCCECRIVELEWEVSDCNDNNQFRIAIDFIHQGPGTEFEVRGNGKNYGTFLYTDLPIVIDGLEGDCDTEYEFVIEDKDNPDCHREFTIGKICCDECRIYDVSFQLLECLNDSCVVARLDFLHENTSTAGFEVFDRTSSLGRFQYSSLPLILSCFPVSGNDFEYIRVCDLDKPDCCADAEVEALDCDTSCLIGELVVETFDCNDSGQYFLALNFEYRNVSDSGFALKVDGIAVNNYSYDSLPIVAGPFQGGCDTNNTIVVCDLVDTTCTDTAIIEEACCFIDSCEIGTLRIERTDCNPDGQFTAIINFPHSAAGDSFRVTGNGKDYGKFAYGQLPIRIGPLEGDCTTNYGFLVRDCDKPDCAEDGGLGVVCCTKDSCEIGRLILEPLDCDTNDMFMVRIDFDHVRTSDSFTLSGNGTNYGKFAYDQLPIVVGPLDGDCDTEYEFVVEDCEENCASDGSLGKICCNEPCEIGRLVIEETACDSLNRFYIEFDFDHARTSDSFSLSGNGNNYGKFAYDDLPLVLGPFEGDCDTEYEFVVEDCEEDCRREGFLGKVCCEKRCEIGPLLIETTDCDSNNLFYADIDFDYANTSDSFALIINGVQYGKYAYTDLPITIGPQLGDCDTEYEFIVKDCERICSRDKNIGKICCEMEPCELGRIILETTECDSNNMFYVDLDFDYARTSDSFSVVGNGNNYGKFAYKDLPIRIGPLEGDCDTRYEFVVRDCEKRDCARDVGLGIICCEEKCEIGELKIEASRCDSNNMFRAFLNFDHANTSDSFTLSGNGTNYGKFAYSDLPVSVGPLEGDCDTEYGFLVRDCEKPDCAEDGRLGKICCEEECEIGEIKIETTDCDSNEMFLVVIDFDYARTSDSFTLTGNGTNYGKFAYSDLPLTLGPLEGDCETEYEFVVRDCEKRECAAEGFLGDICCDEDRCDIRELRIETTDCDSNDMFSVIIDFDHIRTSDSFSVKGNGNNYGKFAYVDLPINIGPLEGDCDTEYEFVVEDCEKECAEDASIGKVCCEENNCEIGRLILEETECDSNNMFFIEINFERVNTSDSFSLNVNGNLQGKFAYEDLPFKFGPFEGDCDTEYEIVVEDCEKRDCRRVGELGIVCCDENACKLSELSVELIDCNGDSCYILKIDFEYDNVKEDLFNIFDRNGIIATRRYENLPVTIECYPITGEDFEYIKICDFEESDCCIETEFKGKDCSTGTDDLEDLGWSIWNNVYLGQLEFTYTGNGSGEAQVDLIDIKGRILKTQKIQGRTVIDLNDLPSNMYFLRLLSQSGQGSMKVIKP